MDFPESKNTKSKDKSKDSTVFSADPSSSQSPVSSVEFFKKNLATHLNELEFKIWLSDLKVRVTDKKILLSIPSDFKREKITERYWKSLQKVTDLHFPGFEMEWVSSKSNHPTSESGSNESLNPPIQPPQAEIQTGEDVPVNPPGNDLKSPLSKSSFSKGSVPKDSDPSFSPSSRRLLPENTLENFLEIPENKLARRFIVQALDRPGAINPIYIYGPVGVGKTHLLHAFSQAFQAKVAFARTEYLTPDDFVSDFTRALNTKTDRNFRIHYRSLDALFIDDIQFFMGKEKSSQEFFHVFNAIHASGKQMIFTSDRDPRELGHLDDRLKSRISSSAIIEIQAPESTSRKALMDFYATREKLPLSKEVREFLGENLPSDIRQIVGAIRYLSALKSLEDPSPPLTVSFCQQHLKQLQVRPAKKKFPPEKILHTICDQFRFNLKDLKAKKKSKGISHCRQTAMYLLRNYTDLSLPEIGFALGGRSVSSVTYGIEKMEKELSGVEGKKLKQKLEGLMNQTFASSVF